MRLLAAIDAARLPRAALSALLVVTLLLQGCASRVERHIGATPAEVTSKPKAKKSPYLNAHLRDGGFIAFSEWNTDSTGLVVSGIGRRLDTDRRLVSEGSMSIPTDSVAVFEASSIEGMNPVLKAMTIIVVAGLVVFGLALISVAIACASNPKCFGSCPTFYVDVGGKPSLMAEGFSASIAPALEATDVDALVRARPRGRNFEMVMKNEALETHVVQSLRLLAVPHGAGGRVFATPDGAFWEASAVRTPRRAVAAEGDIGAAVRAYDGAERTSAVDSTNLGRGETIDLEFDTAPGERVGLVVGSRQTLLTTYLFYETLDAMGASAARWFARLQSGDKSVLDRSTSLGRELGGIGVEVDGADGNWTPVREFNETGPLATDVKIIPLPPATGSSQRVRLRMTRGLFRLDWLALARLEGQVQPIPIEPATVWRDGVPDADALAALRDPGRALVTGPGDAYTIVFDLPRAPERHELFLESRGYYLEWMREKWIEREEPGRLATLLLNPARALRELAPEYARGQVELEDWFWRSRFAHP